MSPYSHHEYDRDHFAYPNSGQPYDHPHVAMMEPQEDAGETDTFTWTWQESLLTIPLTLIVLGTIFGNLLVLYCALTKSNTLRLPTHFLIANLSLADFLVGVFVMPFLATLQITGRWYFGSVYCEAWTVIHFWLCSASILSTCAVCIERYIGVRFPLDHKSIMRRNRIWGMIGTVWVCAGFLTLTSIYIWPQPKEGLPYVCEINQQIGHVIVAVVGILYVPAIIMIILYAQIFVIASRHIKFMKHNSTAGLHSIRVATSSDPKVSGIVKFFKGPRKLNSISESDGSTSEVVVSSSSPRGSSEDLGSPQQVNQKKDSAVSSSSVLSSALSTTNLNHSMARSDPRKKQINLARRLSMLVGVLLASYLPFFTLYMIMAFHPGSIDLRVFMAFGWIRYFNSCLNPFIYAFAVPAYRDAMTQTVNRGYMAIRSKITGG